MTRYIRLMCMAIAIPMLLAIPAIGAQSQDALVPQSSAFFASYGASAQFYVNRSFHILFDVMGKGTMIKLGASAIKIQQSSDRSNWTTIYTFTPSTSPQMICENTSFHCANVTFAGAPGYYYRARVTFYAENSTGSGYASVTTNVVQVPVNS